MSEAMTAVTFPPLLRGIEAPRGADPFAKAVSLAAMGCDAGALVWEASPAGLRAALVFAPEVSLAKSMAMVFAAGSGLADALGALGPPELAVQYRWPGELRVNGARCGRLRADAGPLEDGVPQWLVVGVEIAFALDGAQQPGAAPDATALMEEGCGEITPHGLLESWARHALVWINRWEEEGMRPLHRDWTGRLTGVGGPVSAFGRAGVFMGMDEDGGMLLRRADGGVETIPLAVILEGKAA